MITSSVSLNRNMIVCVEIDLMQDLPLMEMAKNDHSIMALLRMYEVAGEQDETCLETIGKHLWNKCQFADLAIELCNDDFYGFRQKEALLFAFETSMETACLFKTACHAPAAVKIIEPRKIPVEFRFKI